MGLIHQLNDGIIGNRGISGSPAMAYTNATVRFHWAGNSLVDSISGVAGTTSGTVSTSTDNPFGFPGMGSYDFSGGGVLSFSDQIAGHNLGSYDYPCVSVWIRCDMSQHSGFNTVYARRQSSTATDETYLSNNSERFISAYNGSSFQGTWRTMPAREGWQHLCVKFDTGRRCTFLDGVLVHDTGTGYSRTTATLPFHIGNIGNQSEHFDGKICDLTIFESWPSIFGTSSIKKEFDRPDKPMYATVNIPNGVKQIRTV